MEAGRYEGMKAGTGLSFCDLGQGLGSLLIELANPGASRESLVWVFSLALFLHHIIISYYIQIL